MKIRSIDLSKYESVHENDPEVALKIIPSGDAPPMYFKHLKPIGLITEYSKDLIWSKDSRIDIFTTQEEYNKLVCWWFDNIPDNVHDELIELSSKAIDMGWDIRRSLEKAETSLKTRVKEKRKSNLYKFLLEWIGDGVAYWLNKNKKIYE